MGLDWTCDPRLKKSSDSRVSSGQQTTGIKFVAHTSLFHFDQENFCDLADDVVTLVETNQLQFVQSIDYELGGEGGNRTRDRGFADLGLTTWRPRR
jgi:hypothetical protein